LLAAASDPAPLTDVFLFVLGCLARLVAVELVVVLNTAFLERLTVTTRTLEVVFLSPPEREGLQHDIMGNTAELTCESVVPAAHWRRRNWNSEPARVHIAPGKRGPDTGD